MRAWASATMVWFACAWLAPSAQATPSLRVQAGTLLHVSAERRDDHLGLTGSLTDDRGLALGNRDVALRVHGDDGMHTEAMAATDAAGTFVANLPVPASSRLSWHVSFAGGEFHEGSEAAGSLDPTQSPVRLTLRAHRGPSIDLDLEEVHVTVQAWAPAGAANLALQIMDELGRVLARGHTDGDGRFEARLPTGHLEPGTGALIVTSAPDAARAGASHHLAVTRSIASTVTLSARTSPTDRTITLQGAVGTARGPLAQEAVRLEIDGRQVATTLTDHRGVFSTTLSENLKRQDTPATLLAQAHVEPDVPWIRASRSDPIALEQLHGTAPLVTWFLAPVVASLVLAAWLVLRTRARTTPLAPQTTAGAGLRLGHATRRAAPTLVFISGRITDAATAQPLMAASVRLDDDAGASAEVPVSRTGAFRSADLPAGTYVLTASAPGYADVQARIAIPHAGQGSSIAITLSSLRSLALASHRRVVDELVGGDATLARVSKGWTPRDGLQRALATASDPASLAELTSLVESTAYAAAVPIAADLVAVDGRAEALLAQERTRRGPAPRRRR